VNEEDITQEKGYGLNLKHYLEMMPNNNCSKILANNLSSQRLTITNTYNKMNTINKKIQPNK
jgi:hypothetical protein